MATFRAIVDMCRGCLTTDVYLYWTCVLNNQIIQCVDAVKMLCPNAEITNHLRYGLCVFCLHSLERAINFQGSLLQSHNTYSEYTKTLMNHSSFHDNEVQLDRVKTERQETQDTYNQINNLDQSLAVPLHSAEETNQNEGVSDNDSCCQLDSKIEERSDKRRNKRNKEKKRKGSHKCNGCQKIFAKKSHLTKHRRIHTGERPEKRNRWKKSFSYMSYLIRHIRAQMGERSHICELCEKSFRKSKHLIKHIRMHTGELSHKCTNCGKSFSNKSNFKQHKRLHKRTTL